MSDLQQPLQNYINSIMGIYIAVIVLLILTAIYLIKNIFFGPKTKAVALKRLKTKTYCLIDDAQELEHYLQSIYDNYQNEIDLAMDFELAILEKLNGKGISSTNPINQQDIFNLIDKIGSISNRNVVNKDEFKRLEQNKIYKNPGKRILSGLLAGYANFFDFPVWLLRLVFLISIFLLNGWPVFIYIIFSILTPSPDGYTGNLLHEPKKLYSGNFLFKFVERVGTFLQALLPVAGRAIGKILQLSGLFMIPYLLLSGFGLLLIRFLNLEAKWVYSSFLDIYDTLFGDIFFTALILSWTIFWVSIWYLALHTGKNLWKLKGIGSSRIIVSVTGLIVLTFLFSLAIDGTVSQYKILDTNPIQSTRFWKNQNFDSIHLPYGIGLDVSKKYNVIITKSDEKSITIVGNRGFVNNLTVDIVDPTAMSSSYGLNLAEINHVYPFRTCLYCFDEEVTIDIKTPKLKRLTLNMQNRVTAVGFELGELAEDFGDSGDYAADIVYLK